VGVLRWRNVSRERSTPKLATSKNLEAAKVAFAQGVSAARVGISVTRSSYYRTIDHNREVGGAPASQHLLGLAMDFVGRDLERLAQRLTERGFVAIREASHLHVQAYPRDTVPEAWYVSALGPGWRVTA